MLGVRGGLRASDLEVFDGQWFPQGGHQDRVALERVEGGRGRLREAMDATTGALRVAQIARILVDRIARVEAALDPVKGGSHHSPERDVGVRAGIARLELEIRRARLVIPV